MKRWLIPMAFGFGLGFSGPVWAQLNAPITPQYSNLDWRTGLKPGNSAAANSAAANAASVSHSAANAASRSNSVSAGSIAGTQVNAPITPRATSNSVSGGGNASVVVVNKVSAGGTRGAQMPVNTNADPPAAVVDPSPALGSAGNPLTENIGGTTTIRNVPEIIAPNISGGNPCLVGISGGGAGPGIGITFGFGYSDKGCERRNNAAILNNIGQKDAALEVMCNADEVRKAMALVGHPCAEDKATAVASPLAAVDPAVIRRQQEAIYKPLVAQPLVAPPQVPPKPDWCFTASKEELRKYSQCD